MAIDYRLEVRSPNPSLSEFSQFVSNVLARIQNEHHTIVEVSGNELQIRALMAAPALQSQYLHWVRPKPALGVNADLLGQSLYRMADNWWNLDVSRAPLDPDSDGIISRIKSYEGGGRLHPDFTPNFGITYAVVEDATPDTAVVWGAYASESDRGLYPIPPEAKTDSSYIESGGSLEGDRHMLLLNRDNWKAFELGYVDWDGTQWKARVGAIFDLNVNGRRPEGWTSTDAAGLCVLAGLVRHDEVFGLDPIYHALRCSLKYTNAHVWPASHTGARNSGAPPLGMRLRLKASKDISGFPSYIRKIFQAMKTYGLIVADRGGNMYVQGTMDARWNNAELNPAFHALNVSDFEIIKLGWGKPL